MTADRQRTAVVIGGSLAGCFAARALVGQVDRIVVVERDRCPGQPGFRAGTPQGRHAHLLMEGGRRALQDLLPGLPDELLARGAVPVALPGGLRWLSAAGWMPRFSSDLTFLSCTRPALDDAVLRRLRSEPSVEFLEGTEVVGLLGVGSAVSGVQVRARGVTGAPVEDLPAELVVDASGRSSGMPKWLRTLGLPEVAEERVDAGIAYSSRLFRRAAGADPTALYIQTKAPDHPRMGVLLPVEDDRWIVSVGGMRGAEPEPGEAGFDKHLGLLRDPALRDFLDGAEPAGEVRGFRPGASIRRHYERIAPEGLVVLGDAACTFNPVYGQGISIAALGAVALRDTLRQRGLRPGTARQAQSRIAATAKDAWLISSAEDVRFPSTIGGPSGALVRWQHRYLDQVISRATRDEAVCAAFAEVMALLTPPTALFHPRVVWPVLRGPRRHMEGAVTWSGRP
ncbi:2-polyprenyl-6-methoxyphenol hydroxylase-like FAD-dependent oxidoreductase [Streptacidiphilus sp. MAP12-16]|uniref:NAD(P)/FAD-dependent oxidoreductase n=1 Tax=Streptacidiphilus sp. MAP12-16 TaxID=3156300 RepID=UPI003517C843